jgi:hypothetical protein
MEKDIERKRPVKIVVIIIILLAAGYFAFRLIGNWHKRGIDTAIDRQKKVWQVEENALKEKMATLLEELRLQKEGTVSEEKLFEAFGDDATLIFPGKKVNCDVLGRQIKAFYGYLDQKDYIQAYHLEYGTFGFFQEAEKGLSEVFPVLIGETRDLFTLLRNLAHFYRVLGKKRLTLIQEMLKNEAEIIEPAMAIFYAWFTHDDDCKVEKVSPPALKVLYEYSGYFLNTIGGRSYLFRIDSKIRTLISYYSVLILDKANEKAINPYGIDIRPFIDFLTYDIGSRKGLVYQKQYLSELEVLRRKYTL